jgi:Multiubiquitin
MSTGNDAHNGAVRIHIDRKPYESANPTSGEQLYRLAGVPPHRELFREVGSDREDELVPRDAPEVPLHEDEHFYSEKEIILIVNAQKKPWTETTISYQQVTHLAYPEPAPPGIVITYTVEYEHGPHRNREGSLTVGQSVHVKNRMIFVVTETGRS